MARLERRMISRTGQTTRRASRPSLPGAPSRGSAVPAVRAAGFTLIEMLLAVGICLLLLGLGLTVLSSMGAGRALEDGAWRFEGVLRMARAEAANQGRRLRLDFDPQAGTPIILWEPDPVAQPGVFEVYTACSWLNMLPTDQVTITRCQLVGASAYQTLNLDAMNAPAAGQQAALQAVTFYPDGSCDTAEIELVDASGEDPRTAVIDLDGLTGTTATQITTPTANAGS